MICLPTTQILEAVLSGAPATTNPQFTATYGVVATGAPAANSGNLNGSTAVTLVAAPASNLYVVKQLTIYNADTAAVTLTIRLNQSSTYYILWKGVVGPGRTLFYSPETGFRFLDILGGEIAYQEFTAAASITATSEATANTVVTAPAILFDGVTPVIIDAFSPYFNPGTTATQYMQICFYDGSTSLGTIGLTNAQVSSADYKTFYVARRLIPAAGSHTYSLRAFVNAGTGTFGVGSGGVGNYNPGYIRIYRV